MTENQEKLEELLLEHIKNEIEAARRTGKANNVPQTAIALIELWKITLGL